MTHRVCSGSMEPSDRTGRRRRARSGILDTVQDALSRVLGLGVGEPEPLHSSSAGEGSSGSHSRRRRPGAPPPPPPPPPPRPLRVHIRQSCLYSARPRRPRGTSQSTVVNDLSSFKLLSVDSYPDFESFDGFGNLTNWRLNDLEAAYENHLEDEASKPSIEKKKYSKEEKIKLDNDCKEQYMKSALQKYNSEEDLAGEMCFVFDEIKEVVFIVEGDDGETCDVLCCKPSDYNDNGPCFGCKNQGSVNLRHPAGEGLYVGGHEDCEFPFMWDSISEDSDGEG
ncbi:hypothetical protein BRADI_3g32253v3 [Brachypodium distachyon]|uniref:Uncharacterized protein n=1 Tax=Brachypodium distachyon TaxID=15368 RepID=A0A2K2D0J6_BRADI|nr:hypothetical protein BRADI_3g32253v3 [Brachypodium distachyon]